jgi:hypothetical protein
MLSRETMHSWGYLSANKQYFTSDQVIAKRTRIEEGVNLPTPKNKGASGARISIEDDVIYFWTVK